MEHITIISRGKHRHRTPFVRFKGKYFGDPFVLRIFLEPLPETEIREVRDVLRNEVREIASDKESNQPPV